MKKQIAEWGGLSQSIGKSDALAHIKEELLRVDAPNSVFSSIYIV